MPPASTNALRPRIVNVDMLLFSTSSTGALIIFASSTTSTITGALISSASPVIVIICESSANSAGSIESGLSGLYSNVTA